ncbi:MAG: transcriptional regulator, partial [Actinobacteria bacterium]|nr:transcriptional regulator [Actinomycetota bacterium]NIV58435.1 transcriptional regulator [Actinomycetota bacterium]
VCLAAIERLDGTALAAALEAAALELPRPALLSSLLMPLMARVGKLWHEGALRVAHEHLASSIVHSFLGTLHRCSPVPDSAPELIVVAPAGQHHEFGAMTVAVAAATDGWR